jgi:hypothetical protein
VFVCKRTDISLLCLVLIGKESEAYTRDLSTSTNLRTVRYKIAMSAGTHARNSRSDPEAPIQDVIAEGADSSRMNGSSSPGWVGGSLQAKTIVITVHVCQIVLHSVWNLRMTLWAFERVEVLVQGCTPTGREV